MICAVIPTLNCGPALNNLLVQLHPFIDRLVVTDGGSTDETLKIAAKLKARLVSGRHGRGFQLKRGAAWGHNCDWYLFLHADSKLSDKAFAAIAHHIQCHPGQAGYFKLKFDSPRPAARILEWLVQIRCSLFGLPYGDQGLLMSKDLYNEVGGYPDAPLFEDVAIVKAIGKKRLRCLDVSILTNAKKYEQEGYFRRGWKNLGLLRRYLRGETAETLAKDYS